MTEFKFKKKPIVNYVDNAKFYEEISVYHYAHKEAKANGTELPRISNYLGHCIKEIATNLAKRPNFSGYSYVDEMISDAIENCLMYLYSFNPEKSTNPFSYYTQACYFAFLRRIDFEKKQSYIKYKAIENSAIMNNLVDISSDDKIHYQEYLSVMDMDKLASLNEKYGPKPRKKSKKTLEGLIDGDE